MGGSTHREEAINIISLTLQEANARLREATDQLVLVLNRCKIVSCFTGAPSNGMFFYDDVLFTSDDLLIRKGGSIVFE